MPLPRQIQTCLAFVCLAACMSAGAQAVNDDSCELHYRITPRYDAVPRVLDVSVTFPAGGRSETYLQLTREWAGVDDYASYLTGWRGLSPAIGVDQTELPYRFRVHHPASGVVRVAFQARAALANPDDDKPQEQTQQHRTQIGKDWFQFFGYGVLPSVEPFDDDRQVEMCVTVAQPGLAEPPVFGSYFADHGSEVTRHLNGSPRLLLHAFYAGGPGWRLSERQLASGTVDLAVHGSYGAGDSAFADRAAALIDTQKRFWNDTTSSRQWVVVTPNHTPFNTGGTVVYQTAVLFANKTFSPASATFESLIGHENLHQWIPQRLGAHGGDPSAYWFSEGFTDYYTHRLLLASDVWTLQQYADALTKVLRGYWQSPARNSTAQSIASRFFSDRDAGQQMYSRGEVLALRWDQALRATGRPGIDDVLQHLLLPAGADATAMPPASDRLLDALGPSLGASPRHDVQEFIDEGRSLPLTAGLLGPCFVLQWVDVPRWVLGFDPRSFAARKAIGVVVDGPAYRAGLREGMGLASWSVFGKDIGHDVMVAARVDGSEKVLRYRPVDGTHESLPTIAVESASGADAACASWIRRPR